MTLVRFSAATTRVREAGVGVGMKNRARADTVNAGKTDAAVPVTFGRNVPVAAVPKAGKVDVAVPV